MASCSVKVQLGSRRWGTITAEYRPQPEVLILVVFPNSRSSGEWHSRVM